MSEPTGILACCKPWGREAFDRLQANGDTWRYIERKDDLELGRLEQLHATKVFFLHWSWLIPREIHEWIECVGFHMTDLPYGRGGSPLQHLILRGHHTTQLSAFRIVEEVDAGPVYMKRELPLDGRAQDIYERASSLAVEMIPEIIRSDVPPTPQSGAPVFFKRRKPEESRIPDGLTTLQRYDFIRMLDADGYPHAFEETPEGRREYRNARIAVDGSVVADSRLVPHDEADSDSNP